MLKPRKSCSRVSAVYIYTNELLAKCNSNKSKQITKKMLELFPKRSNNQFENHPKHNSEKTMTNIIQRAPRGTEKGIKGRPKAPQGSPRRRRDRLETRVVSTFFARPPQGVPTNFTSPTAAPNNLPKVSQMVNQIQKDITRPHLHNT